jgi:hypothetical protein
MRLCKTDQVPRTLRRTNLIGIIGSAIGRGVRRQPLHTLSKDVDGVVDKTWYSVLHMEYIFTIRILLRILRPNSTY